MKDIIRDVIVGACIAAICSSLFCEVFAAEEKKPQMRMFNPGELVLLDEVGAIIVARDGSLIIEIINPAEHRQEAYKAVDLRKDDVILMLNGKKVTSLDELERGYQGFPVGGELKFGVKRGKDMVVVAFTKGDPKAFRGDFNEMSMGDSTGGRTMTVVRKSGDAGGDEVLPAVGLILKSTKTGVTIAGTLPHVGDVFATNTPKASDRIVSIQDKPVKSMADFLNVFDNLTNGDKVTMTIERDGKSLTTSFIKPKPMGGPMIIQKKSQ